MKANLFDFKAGTMEHIGRASKLAMLAVSGQAIAYVLGVVLARHLGVDGFESYAVASAAFTLMIMYTPRGLEKYSLRLLPALYERREWGLANGFLRFGLRRTFLTALLLSSAVLIWAWFFSDYSPATKLAFVASCLSLPTGALVHYGIEILSANGRDILATALFRVAVPSITLLLVGTLILTTNDFSGAMAVGCWGMAWTLVMAVMVLPVRRSTPHQVYQAKPGNEKTSWAREARPFLYFRISQAISAQVGIIALDRLHTSSAAVGAYVAATGTVNLALVLATATNRFYSRRLSIMLEQRDYAGLLALRRERLRWVLPAMTLFLGVIIGFGPKILGLFRPEFVAEGITALYILAGTTTVCVMFSTAPTYLKYMKRNRTITRLMAGAGAIQIILLVLLVPHFAATGAAIAYSISVGGLYITFSQLAYRELQNLETDGGME